MYLRSRYFDSELVIEKITVKILQKKQIDSQTLTILTILFFAFVLGDLMTTIWLVDNYPGGIDGESNPLGTAIFSSNGVLGMIVAKIAVFSILATSVIMMEYLYKNNKNVMRISHFTLLGLTGWSLVIVTINVMLMYFLSAQGGMRELDFLTNLYGVMFGMIFAALVVLPKFYPKDLKTIQISLAILTVFFPIAFVPELYMNVFLKDSFLAITLFGTIAAMIAVMVIATNKVYKVKDIVSFHVIKHTVECNVHSLSKIIPHHTDNHHNQH